MSKAAAQRVLITGASSGIGAATAAHLVARGHHVYGTSRRPREEPGDGVRWLRMDVCEDESVRKGVETMLGEAGAIDAVVCNAGIGIFGSVEEVTIDDARRQLETNFFGVLRVLRAVLPGMRAARSGRVIVVGSLAGRAPIPFQAHYSASKAALDALTASLANEVREFGVHASLVEPGDIRTPFNDAMDWTTSPTDSAYGERIRSAADVIRKSLPEAPPPEVVARSITRALEARHPRARYAVGAEARIVPFGRRLLPDRINLALIRRHFGLR